MTAGLKMSWDEDIEQLTLSDIEKNGLQVYRNYRRAFDRDAAKKYAAMIDDAAFDGEALARILKLISSEDPRFLPVIACAYADELLGEMFRREMPKDMPGERSSLFAAFGPFGSLSSRIQMAHMFQMVSADITHPLNDLRKIRNKLSHSWDHAELEGYFEDESKIRLFPIETLMSERQEAKLEREVFGKLDHLSKFRVRLIWLVTRLFYESHYFAGAIQRRVDPHLALYGEQRPRRLGEVVKIAMEYSYVVGLPAAVLGFINKDDKFPGMRNR